MPRQLTQPLPITYVSRARRLLMMVLADHFEDAEQKPISRSDAEDMADILHSVNDALWMAETDYFTTIGQYWAVPGGECHYTGAQRALLVRDVEQLRDKLHYEDTKPYCSLVSRFLVNQSMNLYVQFADSIKIVKSATLIFIVPATDLYAHFVNTFLNPVLYIKVANSSSPS